MSQPVYLSNVNFTHFLNNIWSNSSEINFKNLFLTWDSYNNYDESNQFVDLLVNMFFIISKEKWEFDKHEMYTKKSKLELEYIIWINQLSN